MGQHVAIASRGIAKSTFNKAAGYAGAAVLTAGVAIMAQAPTASAATTTIQLGYRGTAAATAQRALNLNKVKAYYPYATYDGYFGPVSDRSLRAWELANKANAAVVADGRITVGSAEWNLLISQIKTAPVVTNKLDPRCLVPGRVLCASKADRKVRYLVNGKVVYTLDARFGKPGYATRNGVFRVYYKNPMHWSRLYSVWMPYSMFFSGGQAIHYNSQFARIGYAYPYGSHGCVNVRDMATIAKVYAQVRIGDRVVVY